jgi:hypothetical protein
MQRKKIVLLLIIFMIASLTGCELIGRPTRIGAIFNEPNKYIGKEVVVEGRSQQSYEINGEPAYDLEDGTGVIPVLYSGTPPRMNERLTIRGQVQSIEPPYEGRTLALRVLRILPPTQPQTRDYVLAILIAIIGGFGIVPAVYSVCVFRYLLHRREPEGAKAASNVWLVIFWFVLLILCVLFILRGYSLTPVYLLFGFVGLSGLIALLLLARARVRY